MVNKRQKSILITQSQLRNLSGSEVVTLELAEYFQSINWKVTVLTHHLSGAMQEECEKSNIETVLTTTNEGKQLTAGSFDVVWIHHYTLTPQLAEDITNGTTATIIFNHMSFFEPLESMMYPIFQQKVANITLFNSQETKRNALEASGVKDSTRIAVLDNPVPDKYYQKQQRSINDTIQRVVVVSNHPPDEIVAASKLLAQEGVVVDFIGRSEHGVEKRVTATLLDEYDTVITIGKTVQYSLTLGMPVYCYDRFGGPGYLDVENYERTHEHNFSGRGYTQKTAEVIAQEIVDNYKKATNSIATLHRQHAKDFLLSTKVTAILDTAKKNKTTKPSQEDNYAVERFIDLMCRVMPGYVYDLHYREIAHNQQRELRESLNKANKKTAKDAEVLKSADTTIAAQSEQITQLKNKVQQLEKFHAMYNEVATSNSYRIGRKITIPVRGVKKVLGKTKHRVGRELRIKELITHLDDVYDIDRSNRRKKIKVDIVLRSLLYPTSSAFIRLISPLTSPAISRRLDVRLVEAETMKPRRDADAIIVQRTAIPTLDDAKQLVAAVRKKDTRLFVDTDDAFGHLDKNHSQYQEQMSRAKALEYIIDHADQTWFSTQTLQGAYNSSESQVFRNTLDNRIWTNINNKIINVPKSNEPLQILYMGTTTHAGDFNMVLPALEKLHEKYPGHFVLNVVGVMQGGDQYPWMRYLQPTSSLYPDFVQWLQQQGPFDIGISPLEDSEFNRSKSDIKCLDYMALGIQPIVSDCMAYKNVELDDYIQRVGYSENDWFRVLSEAIKTKNTSRKNAPERIRAGYDYIRTRRNPDLIAVEIKKLLTDNS